MILVIKKNKVMSCTGKMDEKNLVIPEGVTEIGTEVFADIDCIESIRMPDTVKKIGKWAFKNNRKLKEISLSKALKSIGQGAFAGCKKLTSIELPEGITKIDKKTFEDCSALTKVEYVSLTEVGDGAFSGCKKLDFEWKEGIQVIGENVFGDVKGDKTIPSSVVKLGDGNEKYFKQCANESQILKNILNGTTLNHNNYDNIRKLYESNTAKLAAIVLMEPKSDIEIAEGYKYPDKVLLEVCKIADEFGINIEKLEKIWSWVDECLYDIAPNTLLKLDEKIKKKAIYSDELCNAIEYAKEYPSDEIMLKGATGRGIEKECLDRAAGSYYERYYMAVTDLSRFFDEVYYRADDSNEKERACQLVIYTALVLSISDKQDDKDFAEKVLDTLNQDSIELMMKKVYDTEFSINSNTCIYKLLGRFAGGDVIKKMYADAGKFGRTNQAKRAKSDVVEAICFSRTREAFLILDKEGMLAKAAKLQGVSEKYIRKQLLEDFGFDSQGIKIYDIGNAIVKAVLMPDFSIELLDQSGNKIRSIPKKGADVKKYEEVTLDYKDLKKNVKAVAKQHASHLLTNYALGTEMGITAWKKEYSNNPVTRKVASLLVWSVGEDKDAIYFMPAMDGKYIDSEGNEVKFPKSGSVRLAHPAEMDSKVLDQWKSYIFDNHIVQPFTQIFEKIYHVSSDQIAERYQGVKVLYFQAKKLEKEGEVNYNKAASLYGVDIAMSINSDDRWDGDWSKRTVEFGKLSAPKDIKGRTLNHVISLVDYMCLDGAARTNKVDILSSSSESITEKNIQNLVDAAIASNSSQASAWLMNYQNEHFGARDIWADLEL